MVEETFLSSIRPGSGECTHLAQKSSKDKMSLEIFYEKVAEGLLASARTEIEAVGQTSSPAAWLGPTIFCIEFQRHMLSQRGSPNVRVECVQKKANARPGKR